MDIFYMVFLNKDVLGAIFGLSMMALFVLATVVITVSAMRKVYRFLSKPASKQARFASKRSTKWLGYKVHLTETYGEETPNIITNVQTEEATVNDNYSLPEIHE
jgi:hypothetical protein